VPDSFAQMRHGRIHAVRRLRQRARVAAVEFEPEPRGGFLEKRPVRGIVVGGVDGILQINGVEL
jgi:hypothetical protein